MSLRQKRGEYLETEDIESPPSEDEHCHIRDKSVTESINGSISTMDETLLANGHSASSSDVTDDPKTDATTVSGEEFEKDADTGTDEGTDRYPYPYPYPPLGGDAQENQSDDERGWRAAGIRFAPLHVPLIRRLQTLAVLFHCTAIVFFPALFFFFCAIPLMWPLLIPYLIHLAVSGAASDGKLRYRSEYIRSLPIWSLFGSYFPARLHKTCPLDPTRKYILGYHPHGIISHGAWAAFVTNVLGFKEKFPGITNTVLTLDSNFKMPFYRDWLLAMGLRSVSRESIWNTLTRGGSDGEGMGRAVTIVIGGARESLEAQPGTLKLIINGRKGFIKMALRTGADLVPVLAFGENELYDQLSPKTHPMVHKFQMFCLKVFKFTLPALHGRGVLNYDIGLMPYRQPLNIVVGRPVKVALTPSPEQADIDRLHSLYVAELQKMWEAYKDEFAKDRKSELQFIA